MANEKTEEKPQPMHDELVSASQSVVGGKQNGAGKDDFEQSPSRGTQSKEGAKPGAPIQERSKDGNGAPSPNQSSAAQQPWSVRLGVWLPTCFIVTISMVVATIAVRRSVVNPRTDDAEVLANYIGMAPQVDGPISHLSVRDNQYVHAGDLLFTIDDRPYKYALDRALSEQAALEGQIEDKQRSIASQKSAEQAAAANVLSNASSRSTSSSTINESQASVEDARAAVLRAKADRQYAASNLQRLEPLLEQQFVTADQVDQARTLVETRSRAVDQARAQLALDQAKVVSNLSRYDESNAQVEQSRAQRRQAANAVETLKPLSTQRQDRLAAVDLARYNYNNCHVYAPFDAFVTNLTVSEGAYVHTGTQVFTLIDNRVWWVVANFRETQLAHLDLGLPADVFLMAREGTPLHGVVESIGSGVTPDPSVVGVISPGLPSVERTLSWVHLAARYPVRIRIQSPPPNLLRVGQTAVTVVHGSESAMSTRER